VSTDVTSKVNLEHRLKSLLDTDHALLEEIFP
jgi:hypothetical protein